MKAESKGINDFPADSNSNISSFPNVIQEKKKENEQGKSSNRIVFVENKNRKE